PLDAAAPGAAPAAKPFNPPHLRHDGPRLPTSTESGFRLLYAKDSGLPADARQAAAVAAAKGAAVRSVARLPRAGGLVPGTQNRAAALLPAAAPSQPAVRALAIPRQTGLPPLFTRGIFSGIKLPD